jgi:hypothetical protein
MNSNICHVLLFLVGMSLNHGVMHVANAYRFGTSKPINKLLIAGINISASLYIFTASVDYP